MRQLFIFLIGLLTTITLSAYAEDTTSMTLTLNTNSFTDKGILPVLYTCDGTDVSPELNWSNVPANTQSLAIIISDPDAPSGTFYHWIVYNIPPSTKMLDEGIQSLPAGALVGKNDFGKQQYNGPCPPKGSIHTYIITLYALDTKLTLPAGANAKTVISAIQTHTVGKASLSTTYHR